MDQLTITSADADSVRRALIENVAKVVAALRRPRRDRLYPAAHWRARLASWFRSVADRLNPLKDSAG